METSSATQEPATDASMTSAETATAAAAEIPTENAIENVNATTTTTAATEPEKKEKILPSFTTKEGVRLIKLGRASAGHETAFLLTGDGMVLGWNSKAMSLKFG